MTIELIPLSRIITKDTLQPRIEMNMFVVNDYAEAMKEGAPLPPIEVVWDGEHYYLWDGFHRKRAAEKIKCIEILANITKGTLEDAEWLALGANKTHGMRRSNEDKHRAVKLALEHSKTINEFERYGKINYTAIANHCGVSHPFVIKLWNELHPPKQVSKNNETCNGFNFQQSLKLNGATRSGPTEKLAPQALELLDLEPIADDRQTLEAIARMPIDKQAKVTQRIVDGELAVTLNITSGNEDRPLSQPMQVLLSHKSIEYYTPPYIIEAARYVMGQIDLDPASCEDAQENVRAENFFSQAEDGLSKNWYGKVWLNPPYSKTNGRSNQEVWAEKLLQEYELGHVDEAILLVKSALGYNWFEDLWDRLPVCFIRQRLSFTKSDGTTEGQSKHGTALLYVGSNQEKFIEIFSQFGRITTPEGDFYLQRIEDASY